MLTPNYVFLWTVETKKENKNIEQRNLFGSITNWMPSKINYGVLDLSRSFLEY